MSYVPYTKIIGAVAEKVGHMFNKDAREKGAGGELGFWATGGKNLDFATPSSEKAKIKTNWLEDFGVGLRGNSPVQTWERRGADTFFGDKDEVNYGFGMNSVDPYTSGGNERSKGASLLGQLAGLGYGLYNS